MYHLYESDGTQCKALPMKYERSVVGTSKTHNEALPSIGSGFFVPDHSYTAPRNRSDLFTERARATVLFLRSNYRNSGWDHCWHHKNETVIERTPFYFLYAFLKSTKQYYEEIKTQNILVPKVKRVQRKKCHNFI